MKAITLTRDMEGKEVDVYFNRHLKLFSVRCREINRVVGHTDSLVLSYVNFVVQLSGWKKTRRTGTRTNHAFARGNLFDFGRLHDFSYKEHEVSYNPFMNPFFYLVKHTVGTPCNSALYAYLNVHDGRAIVHVDTPNAIIKKKSDVYR